MSHDTPTLRSRTQNALSSHRKRAREKGQVLDYGLDDLRIMVKEALQLPCCYCGVSMHDTTWSSDHATPISRGGSFSIWNVQITCKHCNEAKGALTHEEFSALLAILRDWSSVARMNVIQRLRHGGKFRR